MVSLSHLKFTSAAEYLGHKDYKGCWIDQDHERDLDGVTKDFGKEMTPDKCFKFCSDRGYKFAGLENEHLCSCDNEFGKYGLVGSADCNCPCMGDPQERCGCELRQKVYQLDVVQTNQKKYFGDYHYKGCYVDDLNKRDLSGSAKMFPSMDLDKCFDFCNINGFKYAGLQNKTFCYCGNSYGSYSSLPSVACECPCSASDLKTCGCELTNRVFELSAFKHYEKPSCARKGLKCGCWGDPHCYTFDKMPFSFMGACKYDLVSTNCHGSLLPSNLVQFEVRQGQEKRSGFPGGSFVEYLEIEVLGKIYKFFKSNSHNKFVFTVDGLSAMQPYKDESRGITVIGTWVYMIFNSDFGLKVLWDGSNTRAQVTLCSAYAGHTCGLCGNGDGKRDNEFTDRIGNPVDVNTGGKWTRHYNWGSQWKSLIQHGEIDQDGNWCNNTLMAPPDCKNEKKYENAYEYCGIMKNMSMTTGPWAQCLMHMDLETAYSYIEGCTMDMCMSEGNATEQHLLLCEAYDDFNIACQEEDPEWHANWRTATGCELKCPANQTYAIRRECPKTCTDPEGKLCDHVKWVEGCYCSDGLVMDADGKCISFKECGCPLNDTIIPVGEVVISADCSALYLCKRPGSDPKLYNEKACSPHAYCLKVNNSPVCKCREGYTGDGYTCAPISRCNANYCYGFGDPHYRTEYGRNIELNNTCSYILATDAMAFVQPTFTIIVDHEDRYNNDLAYMRTIRITLGANEYSIGRNFRVNGARVPLPYKGEDFSVVQSGVYIKFDHPNFIVEFDGITMLKLRVCASTHFGICHLQNDNTIQYPFKEFLARDSECDIY